MKLEIDVFKDAKERVAQHLKDHKEAYITGAVCVTIGLVAGKYSSSAKQIIGSQIIKGNNNTAMNITTNIIGNKRLSKIVQNVDTGEMFLSQAEAARKFGLREIDISRHLNLGKPLPNGLRFERQGVHF